MLAEAASTVAGPGHRTVATLGGNLCLDTRCVFYNQSEWWRRANEYCLKLGGDTCHVAPQGKRCHAAFSGDLAPALIVLDADVEIAGPHSVRRVPLADLYIDDGAAHLCLDAGEIVVAVRIPAQPAQRAAGTGRRGPAARSIFRLPASPRVSTSRRTHRGLSRRADRHELAAVPARRHRRAGRRPTSTMPLAELGKLVQKQVSPMRTTVTHSNYRRQVAAVLAQRLVRELVATMSTRRLRPDRPMREPAPRKRWVDADGVHIDVRGLAPPEPLVAILSLIESIRDERRSSCTTTATP